MFVAALAFSLAGVAGAAGSIYWVDDDGDDAWSGTAAERTGATTAEGVTIGPKRTLKAGMALAKTGDVVKVLPGTYREGEDANNARVCVKSNVKLVSTGGRDVTFIYGSPSPSATGSGTAGNGAGAVRCAYLEGAAAIFGFTLTGGHTDTTTDETCTGGGAYGTGRATVVDCVISNCYARRGGAAAGDIQLVNTVVDGCGANKAGNGLYLGKAWGCLFRNMRDYALYVAEAYNCTVDGHARGTDVMPAKLWDSALYHSGSCLQAANCCLVGQPSSDSDWSDSDNRIGLDRATQLAADANLMPVKGTHVGIDAGNWDRYTNGFPSVAWDYVKQDVYGKRRVVNGRMDIGAVECDYLKAFADDLAAGSAYFAVTNATDGVREREAGASVALPVGEALCAAWDIPENDTMNETYALTVALSGDAVLKVYADGELVLTLTRAGAASYVRAGCHGVRFVCEGTTGEAVLSGLATTAHRPYFVAPAPKGDDANDGLTADTPKETLAAVAALATEPGSIIHAAPGVYNKGVSGPVGSQVTTNRVVLAEGIGLLGDEGAAVTVIEGAQNADGFAYATNVVRCCYLKAGAWIRGFTLRGGGAAAVTKFDETGGGVTGTVVNDEPVSAAVECVFTNNVALRGDSTSNVDLIRCLVYGGGKPDEPGNGTAYDRGRLVDCVFAHAAHAYTLDAVVNCTFDGGQVWSNVRDRWCENGKNMVMNSIVSRTAMNRKFLNCTIRDEKLRDEKTSEADADCRFGVSVALDGLWRPLGTETGVIDGGTNDYYETYFPARWARFREGRDFAGGARVYNGRIDLGAGEYDWRPGFAKRLARRRLSVAAASSRVSIGETDGLTLTGGDVLDLRWNLVVAGPCSFRVACASGAAAEVRVDGEPCSSDSDGVYSFAGSVGEHAVSIACFGSGSAQVGSFASPRRGVLFLVR